MKKTLLLMISCILLIFIIFGITACGNKSENTNYSSEYQKVKVAFDGVEASFSSSSNAKSRNAYDVAYAEDKAEAALQTIFSQYTSGDKQSGSFDELDYDEPPMRQFQYLKAIFEEMGGDYKLGTKYYYNITGDMYFDIETGYRVEKTKADANNYKYAYVFGFSMNIELRENNLIFAEVGFNISLTQGQKNYKTSWYVSFDLDYDFDENTPTYTLHMYTDNKESALKYLHHDQGYEYDYVCMEKGAIKEWRKFDMDCNNEIVISESHPSFDSYVEENLVYNVGTCKWLRRNGDYYKITRETEEKSAIIAKAFVDGLGMNSTSINSAPFFAKEGEVNKVIDTYYKKICELYGDDIIYDLVCDVKDDDNEGNNQPGTWESRVLSFLSNDLPVFASSTATFSVQNNNGEIVITVNNPSRNDYSTYEAKLLEEGFIRNDEAVSAAVGAYIKVDGNGNAVIIVIDEVNNKISIIENVDSSGSNNENNQNNEKTYPIDNGIDFVGEYLAVAMGDVFAKDISGVIEELSDGNIKANNLNSFISGKLYTFTLANANKAKDTATRYGGKYMDSGEWTNRYTNSVNYKEGRQQDVLVLIASSNSNNEAYLYVYVLLFNGGTVKNIVDYDAGGNDDNGNGGEEDPNTDEPGDERMTVMVTIRYYDSNKKEINHDSYLTFIEGEEVNVSEFTKGNEKAYADTNCTDEIDYIIPYEGLIVYVWAGNGQSDISGDGGNGNAGEIGGGGEQGNENQGEGGQGEQETEYSEGDPSIKVTVTVAMLDKNQNRVGEDAQYTYNYGQTIDVSKFITEEGQKVYREFPYSEDYVVNSTINAYDGMVLYVWKKLPKGTFTIYNVIDDEEPVLWSQFDTYIGSGDYFGYSFGWLVYFDAGCKEQVPLDYSFELTEDGITIYRHIYEEYFILETNTYVNGHLSQYDTTSRVLRKGVVYNAYGYQYGVVDDYYAEGLFYFGEGKNNEVTGNSYIATTEDKVTISKYLDGDEYHVYTIKNGDEVITEDYVTMYDSFDSFYYAEGSGHPFTYKNYQAEYCTLSGNVISMHKVTKLKGPLKYYRVVKTENQTLSYVDPGWIETWFNLNPDNQPSFYEEDFVEGNHYECYVDEQCTSHLNTSHLTLYENEYEKKYVVT
ncbi:MAG: hypothetical protein K5765_00805, partial [Clostridia bacterium]|nr:hypothetical protein [Clostridia bacterium]